MKHKKKNEIKLWKNEKFTEDIYIQITENDLNVVAFWLRVLEQVSVVQFV